MTHTTAILVKSSPRQVAVGTIELPQLGATDVLVRSLVIGICRSDIELRDGHLDHIIDVNYPVVPGHEWCGEVVEVGQRVTNVAAGDRVVGECLITDKDWFGCNVNGAGSELFVAPASVLHRLPDEIDNTMGAIVEPFTIAFRAVRESGRCDAGDVVAVVGGGMIGQCAAAICRANGAEVVMVEPNPRRREMSTKLGVDHTIDPADLADSQAWFTERLGVTGPHLVVEASGASAGIATAMRIADFGGRVVMIGIAADADTSAPVNLIQAKNLTVRGVTGSPNVWPAALRFIARAGLDLRALVSESYSFADAPMAFAAAEDPENFKIHLSPNGVA